MTQLIVGSFASQPVLNQTAGAWARGMWSRVWGDKSDSGIEVTPETALGHTPLWHGLLLLGGDTGSLDLNMRRQVGDRFENDTTHTAYMLADVQSNVLMCANNFWEMMVPRAALWGNAIAEIRRDMAGRPLPVSRGGGLIPLAPEYTFPEFDVRGKVWIKTTEIVGLGKTQERRIDPVDTVHISGLSTDGFWGRKLTDVAKNRIGNGLGLAKQQNRIMDNRMMPDVLLSWPHQLSPEDRQAYEDKLKEENRGVENAGKTLMLDDGVTPHKLGMDLESAQFAELVSLDVQMVASLLGIPAIMLNAMDKMTFNNTEESERWYINRTLRRWLNKITKELRAKLLTEREQAQYHFQFVLDPLLMGKLSERYEAYQKAVGSMWMSRNEVRAKEGMNPGPPELDEFVNPNTTSGGEPTTPEVPDEGLAAEQLKSIVGREDRDVYNGCRGQKDVLQWLEEYYHGPMLKRLFEVCPKSAGQYCTDRLNLWRKISGHVQTRKALAEIVSCQRQTGGERVARLLTEEFLNNGQTTNQV